MSTCYMCEKRATSREHVPPRCIFPEQKDTLDGKDYRKNLMTVGSCNEHNLEKSTNDQFLLAAITLYFENNDIASQHYENKVARTLEKSPGTKSLLTDKRIVSINGMLMLVGRIDAKRLEKEIENIARALYFLEFNKKHKAPLVVQTPSMLSDIEVKSSYALTQQRKELKLFMNAYMKRFTKKGDNQEVFYYQIAKNTEADRLILKMVFYEGFEVYVCTRQK